MAPARSFTYAGSTLMVERSGTGRPVYVLIHGIGMGRSIFADLMAHLDDSAQVVAIDLPGYGEAPEPARVLTMERTADLVAAYLRAHATSPAVVIGHSMGAQVALEIAARHPDLTAALVLIGPTVEPGARTVHQQVGRLMRDLAVESPKVIARGAREYVRSGPKRRVKLRAMLVHRPEKAFALVQAPTLVLRGEDDRVATREWCLHVVGAISDARYEEVPGHGHETMIRDAAPAAALIQAFARDE